MESCYRQKYGCVCLKIAGYHNKSRQGGKKGIVSFPNFSYWNIRMQLLLKGYAPISQQLPYEWHNTPNIRVITIKDFRRFAGETGFDIIREVAINTHNEDRSGNIIKFLPNLRATYGIFLIGKDV